MTTKRTGYAKERTPRLIRRGALAALVILFAAVLAAAVALQVAIPVKPHFPAEGVFGAAAMYGFGTCLLMVVFAWLLGKLLKRREHYYETPDDD